MDPTPGEVHLLRVASPLLRVSPPERGPPNTGARARFHRALPRADHGGKGRRDGTSRQAQVLNKEQVGRAGNAVALTPNGLSQNGHGLYMI